MPVPSERSHEEFVKAVADADDALTRLMRWSYSHNDWAALQEARNVVHRFAKHSEAPPIEEHPADFSHRVRIDAPDDDDDDTLWTVTGDLRAPNSGMDESNYGYTESVKLLLPGELRDRVSFDPEFSCFFAYCQSYVDAVIVQQFALQVIGGKPWVVDDRNLHGDPECWLGSFATMELAGGFISLLPDHEKGRYNLTGPPE